MCREWSALIDKDFKVFSSDGMDSHSELIKKFSLSDKVSDKEKLEFAKVEVVPRDSDYVLGVDVSRWDFVLDEEVTPTWWTDQYKIEVMAEFKKYHARKYKIIGMDFFAVTLWHESGAKSSEENYKAGKREGKWTWWYESGAKASEANYKAGEREGKWTEWHSNGTKASEANYKAGKREGKWTEWHSNGAKASEENYKAGKREGRWTWWRESGAKSMEGNYKAGEREGKWTEWHSNGAKASEVNYKAGVLIK